MFSDILLQTPPPSLTLWDMCLKGGWIMIILAVLLAVSVYVLIERLVVLRTATRLDDTFMHRIKDYILEGDTEAALSLCKGSRSSYAVLIAKGITRIGRPTSDVMMAIENTGNIEVARLSRGLSWLATTAAGAPMLGFLGTVIGMVQAFYDIAQSGTSAQIATFAGGIYTALVTTVAGLVVGIAALFAYNLLVAQIQRVMHVMEAKTMQFMDLLNEPLK